MCFFKYTLICHREGGRDSDRGNPVNYNKVARMRVHIITGLPRFARNDKGGAVRNDMGLAWRTVVWCQARRVRA